MLILDLVETVQGYAVHERDTLECMALRFTAQPFVNEEAAQREAPR